MLGESALPANHSSAQGSDTFPTRRALGVNEVTQRTPSCPKRSWIFPARAFQDAENPQQEEQNRLMPDHRTSDSDKKTLIYITNGLTDLGTVGTPSTEMFHLRCRQCLNTDGDAAANVLTLPHQSQRRTSRPSQKRTFCPHLHQV